MTELLKAMQLVDATIKEGRACQEDVECVLKYIETAILDEDLCYEAISSYMEADKLSKELVEDIVDVTFVKQEVIAMAVELGKSLDKYDGNGCTIFEMNMDYQSYSDILATMNNESQYELIYKKIMDEFNDVLYEYTDEYGNYYCYTYNELEKYDDIYQMERKLQADIDFKELVSMSQDDKDLLNAFRIVYGFNPTNVTEKVRSQVKRVYEYIYGNVEKCFHSFYKAHFNDSYYDVSLYNCFEYQFDNICWDLLPVYGIRDMDNIYSYA